MGRAQLQRVAVNQTKKFVRGVSTAGSEYPGSQNYVPGKQGYAPGFPPPKKWPAAPQPKPDPQKSGDVPPPSPKQTHMPRPVTIAKDAARLYKQKMREIRYAYYRENLEAQEKKAEENAKKQQKMLKLVRERREKLRKEREDYEINVRADPLSAENVLNAEGKTLVSNLPALDQDKSCGYRLAPPQVSVSIPVEANEARKKERAMNRELMKKSRHVSNVQALMTLFHEAKSFVHYDNLDYKVNAFIESASFPNRSLAEMIEVLQKSGGVVTSPVITQRTQELQNVLQGTTGIHGSLGYDGLVKWMDEQSERKNELSEDNKSLKDSD